MTIRIIDYKKIDLTEDEWQMYQDICKSYDKPNFKGEDLFNGLFETDDDGIIVYINPPSKTYVSLEVFLFVVAVFNHQHVRLIHSQVKDFMKTVDERLSKLESK